MTRGPAPRPAERGAGLPGGDVSAPRPVRAHSRRGGHEEEHEEHENHERWLVSYADMMTLLMVLFIVMFAISEVNQRKFDASAPACTRASGRRPRCSTAGATSSTVRARVAPDSPQIPGSTDGGSGGTGREFLARTWRPAGSPSWSPRTQQAQLKQEVDNLKKAETALKAALARAGVASGATFRFDERGLVVTIATDKVLFDSGSAQLRPQGRRILDALEPTLAALPNRLSVGRPHQLAPDLDVAVPVELGAVDRPGHRRPALPRRPGHASRRTGCPRPATPTRMPLLPRSDPRAPRWSTAGWRSSCWPPSTTPRVARWKRSATARPPRTPPARAPPRAAARPPRRLPPARAPDGAPMADATTTTTARRAPRAPPRSRDRAARPRRGRTRRWPPRPRPRPRRPRTPPPPRAGQEEDPRPGAGRRAGARRRVHARAEAPRRQGRAAEAGARRGGQARPDHPEPGRWPLPEAGSVAAGHRRRRRGRVRRAGARRGDRPRSATRRSRSWRRPTAARRRRPISSSECPSSTRARSTRSTSRTSSCSGPCRIMHPVTAIRADMPAL